MMAGLWLPHSSHEKVPSACKVTVSQQSQLQKKEKLSAKPAKQLFLQVGPRQRATWNLEITQALPQKPVHQWVLQGR